MATDPATGYKLCKRGHVRSPENVSANKGCKECSRRAAQVRSADPEYRARQNARRRGPDFRAKANASRRARRADPEYRAAEATYERGRLRDPECRARRNAAALKHFYKKRDALILADPAIQEYLRLQNPLTKKLEALIADLAASQGEKDNAYQILERKGLLPAPTNRRHLWLRRQTTFGETPNTQHATKSLPRSASL